MSFVSIVEQFYPNRLIQQRVTSSTFLTNSHFDLDPVFKVMADMFHSKYNSGTFLNGEVYEVHIKYVGPLGDSLT